ncbi:MAG: GMC family oxidoreductase N-terminal domain-containing protein [Rhizobiales bacterium]|nr:GMC family oxidoreductase N-terminal domain-containing protein [Hyphomicrobiales bacterium]
MTRSDSHPSSDAFDYMIIGGGSAGCLFASRLSRAPVTRVLLLGAGRKDD